MRYTANITRQNEAIQQEETKSENYNVRVALSSGPRPLWQVPPQPLLGEGGLGCRMVRWERSSPRGFVSRSEAEIETEVSLVTSMSTLQSCYSFKQPGNKLADGVGEASVEALEVSSKDALFVAIWGR